MTDNSAFGELFGSARLMAILRGMGTERSLAVATTAWDLGIEAVEIPVQTPADVEALRVVATAAAARGLRVGAGTVVTGEHVQQAKDAGAAFTVSPGFDVEVVRSSAEAGMPSLPGVGCEQPRSVSWFWFRFMSGPLVPMAAAVLPGCGRRRRRAWGGRRRGTRSPDP
ncbi:hypothetical protein BKD30_12905, partial [Tersicoccus phoenicis]